LLRLSWNGATGRAELFSKTGDAANRHENRF
jgi:hypothetical protein